MVYGENRHFLHQKMVCRRNNSLKTSNNVAQASISEALRTFLCPSQVLIKFKYGLKAYYGVSALDWWQQTDADSLMKTQTPISF